jgi:hypothetical protein
MDNRLEQALEFSNYKTTVFQQKQDLKLKLETTLMHAVNGGIFKVSQELISFVDVLLRKEVTEAVLIDSRANPVRITDLISFQENIIGLYFEAANEYHVGMEKLRKARSVGQATGV